MIQLASGASTCGIKYIEGVWCSGPPHSRAAHAIDVHLVARAIRVLELGTHRGNRGWVRGAVVVHHRPALVGHDGVRLVAHDRAVVVQLVGAQIALLAFEHPEAGARKCRLGHRAAAKALHKHEIVRRIAHPQRNPIVGLGRIDKVALAAWTHFGAGAVARRRRA